MSDIEKTIERAKKELSLYAKSAEWQVAPFLTVNSSPTAPGTEGWAKQYQARVNTALEAPDLVRATASGPQDPVAIDAAAIVAARFCEPVVIDLAQFAGQSVMRPMPTDRSASKSMIAVPVQEDLKARVGMRSWSPRGVVTFASNLTPQQVMEDRRLLRIASKQAELILDTAEHADTNKPSAAIGQLSPGIKVSFDEFKGASADLKNLIYGKPSTVVGKKFSKPPVAGFEAKSVGTAGWEQFIEGSYASPQAIGDFKKRQTRLQESAEYLQKNLGFGQ